MSLQEQIPKSNGYYILTIQGTIVNMIGKPMSPFAEHENHHFDNEWDVPLSFQNYKGLGYSLELDLLTISY